MGDCLDTDAKYWLKHYCHQGAKSQRLLLANNYVSCLCVVVANFEVNPG
jgi:hypothetical protein